MCSYIVEKATLVGSAKGRSGWMKIDTANVYFDHPSTPRSTTRSASTSSMKATAAVTASRSN